MNKMYIISLFKIKNMAIKIYHKFKIEDEKLRNEFIQLMDSCDGAFRRKIKVSFKKDVRKYIYYLKVWLITEQNAPQLKDNHMRGKVYCLNHITPVSHGYENNIDPSIIGGLHNIRIIKHKDNLIKNRKIIKNINTYGMIKYNISDYPKGSNTCLGDDGNKPPLNKTVKP